MADLMFKRVGKCVGGVQRIGVGRQMLFQENVFIYNFLFLKVKFSEQ